MLELRAFELGEELFGAIQQSRAMEILRKLENGRLALVRGKIGAIEQVLMHADGAVELALAPEETSQRKMQIDGLRIDLHHFDERLDGLVRLLVEQEIQAAKIRERQCARFAQ